MRTPGPKTSVRLVPVVQANYPPSERDETVAEPRRGKDLIKKTQEGMGMLSTSGSPENENRPPSAEDNDTIRDSLATQSIQVEPVDIGSPVITHCQGRNRLAK